MITVFVIVYGYVTFEHIGYSIEKQMANSALDYAKTIASMKTVQEGLGQHAPYSQIQKLIEAYRKQTRYQYVIVMDMEGIQYSYPYKSGLGKRYKNGGEEKVLTEGIAETSADRNELISAIRAFAPVYYNNEQVGAVLVGLLTDEVQKESEYSRWNVQLTLVIFLFAGILIAYLLAKNIKKSTFGLEPKEIGLLLSERELILKSIDRGMIAVDIKGDILIMNERAKDLLKLPEDAIGKPLTKYHKLFFEYIQKIIKSGSNDEGEEKQIDKMTKVFVRACLMLNPNKQVVGAVATLESYSDTRKLAEKITDYEGMIDSLRAQRHEFMNKLHTVSGLIQLEAYEEALDFIDEISNKSDKLQKLITKSIIDQKVAGLILAKYNRLSEAKIELNFLEESYLTGFPGELDAMIFCTILGNLLDNSKDALEDVIDPYIEVLIQCNEHHCYIRVKNNGPIIEEKQGRLIFEKNYTTKIKGNGMGLYIVKNELDNLGGHIEFINDKGVTWHVRIPK
jgi:two-component system CitB family sensor kinase